MDGNKGYQEEAHRPTHMLRRLFLDLLLIRWRGCVSAMGVIKLTPSCSSPELISQSILGIFGYTIIQKYVILLSLQ